MFVFVSAILSVVNSFDCSGCKIVLKGSRGLKRALEPFIICAVGTAYRERYAAL